MTHKINEQWNEGWTVNKKRKRGEEEDGEHTKTGETFRKFGRNLGSFRTEAEILAVLHLKYPWVKIVRRIRRTDNTLLFTKDYRSRKVLTEVKDLNGKEYSFQPMDTMFKKTYILMGVPSCITDNSSYSTIGHTDDKMEQQHKIGKPHRHGDGSFNREGKLHQIYQRVLELRHEALCERT